MINVDVVTRYYLPLERYTHSQIHLLTYLLMTYEYRETFRRGLTADSRLQDYLGLLWTVAVDLWSNSVDWCGSKSYNPHTSVDRTTPAWDHHCRPPTKLSHTAATAIISFNRAGKVQEQTRQRLMRPLKLVLWCHLCVLNGAVSTFVYWLPTGRLFRTFQVASIKWPSLR